MVEAMADALLDLAMSDQGTLHAGVEPDRARHPAVARMVHGDVRTAQDVGDSGFCRRSRGDARKGPDLNDFFLEQQRPGHRPQPSLREFIRPPHCVGAQRERDRELVAGQPGEDRARPELVGKRHRDGLEEAVAGLVRDLSAALTTA